MSKFEKVARELSLSGMSYEEFLAYLKESRIASEVSFGEFNLDNFNVRSNPKLSVQISEDRLKDVAEKLYRLMRGLDKVAVRLGGEEEILDLLQEEFPGMDRESLREREFEHVSVSENQLMAMEDFIISLSNEDIESMASVTNSAFTGDVNRYVGLGLKSIFLDSIYEEEDYSDEVNLADMLIGHSNPNSLYSMFEMCSEEAIPLEYRDEEGLEKAFKEKSSQALANLTYGLILLYDFRGSQDGIYKFVLDAFPSNVVEVNATLERLHKRYWSNTKTYAKTVLEEYPELERRFRSLVPKDLAEEFKQVERNMSEKDMYEVLCKGVEIDYPFLFQLGLDEDEEN